MPNAARRHTPPATPPPIPALAPVDKPVDAALLVVAREGDVVLEDDTVPLDSPLVALLDGAV